MAESINRRTFLQATGASGMSLALGTRNFLSEPGIAAETNKEGKDRLPLQPTAFTVGANNISGIPLGGIGAGSIEIRPDGYFDDWLIFNTGGWSPEQPDTETGPAPEVGPEGLQFFLRTEQEDSVKLRRLGIREDQNDLYSISYAWPVEHIVFDGKFPFATLQYVDKTLPVEVTGLAFAPIIPYDSRTSATPGFTLAFKVKNTTNKKVKASLMGALANPLAVGASDRNLTNVLTSEGETMTLALSTAATTGRKSCHGSMALSVTGGNQSFIQGTYRQYLGNGYWGGSRGYGSAHYSYLNNYREHGRLPSLANEHSLDSLLKGTTDAQIDAMTLQELETVAARARQDPMFAEFISRIELIDANQISSQAGLTNLAKQIRDMLNGASGRNRDRSSWGDVALESTIELEPNEEKEIRFVLSWFFPNHFSKLGPNLGHQYEHWFRDAADVNSFLVKSHASHREATIHFAETLLTTNLAPEIAFSWSAQLTTMIKSSWWCKDGRFAMWEGLGCCGLHTTDITYQGSFPIIALFPDLQMQQIKMGASYQRQDGRIPHFFAPDLLHVDNGFDRVDMNPQYVMMVCRDYLWTGDLEYVRNNWPHVVRAMVSTQKLDTDGDGLPDHETSRNTYDQWDLEGSPAYICSLWLGALRSAVRLAKDLGEQDQEKQWADLLDKASKSFESRLWNGDYFNLWVSDTGKDECCMSDQLSGEWYSGLMGIGRSVPRERIIAAMQAVHKNNFDPESGLRNATYPKGKAARFKTQQNFQAVGNWTGIEYANASLMIEMGMVQEGLDVIHSVHDRYQRTGRRWNHVECGDHYYRAMSSWTTLLALTGFHLDASTGTVQISPKITGLTAPWFSPTAYGSLASAPKALSISCSTGSMMIKHLKLGNQVKDAKALLNGHAVPAKPVRDGDGFALEFEKPVALTKGDKLDLKF